MAKAIAKKNSETVYRHSIQHWLYNIQYYSMYIQVLQATNKTLKACQLLYIAHNFKKVHERYTNETAPLTTESYIKTPKIPGLLFSISFL